jgi:hypothetical protein
VIHDQDFHNQKRAMVGFPPEANHHNLAALLRAIQIFQRELQIGVIRQTTFFIFKGKFTKC